MTEVKGRTVPNILDLGGYVPSWFADRFQLTEQGWVPNNPDLDIMEYRQVENPWQLHGYVMQTEEKIAWLHVNDQGDLIPCQNFAEIETHSLCVRPRPDDSPVKSPRVYCSRCGGSGYLEQYSHVDGGRCFKCT